MNKKTLMWISSLICLSPIAFSATVYSSLPGKAAMHWDSAGASDSFVHEAAAAFGIPMFFLIVNFLSKISMLNDLRGERQPQAIKQLITWLIPAASIVLTPVTLSIAMGANMPIAMISAMLVGMLLVVIRNYLPKSRQNYTIGIRLPWTLHDFDNWNKTHRLAGRLWIAGGLALIACNLMLPSVAAQISSTAIIVAAMFLIPMLFSYAQYTRRKAK
ncbi:MAG: SdpI family protein [Clostridiales bacterium]|nr:SdpI family protein [Clostridiales bacterium]